MRNIVFPCVSIFLTVFFLSFSAASAWGDSSCDEVITTFRQEIYKADADFQKQAAPVLVRVRKQRRQAIHAAAKTAIQRLESMAKLAEQKGDTTTAGQARQALEQVEKVRNTAAVPVPMSRVKLPSYKGHQYLAVLAPVSWREAREACYVMGGHLAYAETRDELYFLKKLTKDRTGIWLGATDRHEEGNWIWLNGIAVDEKMWRGGQPNNRNGEHFCEIKSGELNDHGKSDDIPYKGFVCEWDPDCRYEIIAPELSPAIKDVQIHDPSQTTQEALKTLQSSLSGYPVTMQAVLKPFIHSVNKAEDMYRKRYNPIIKLQTKRTQSIEESQKAALNQIDQLAKNVQGDQVKQKDVATTKDTIQAIAKKAIKTNHVKELWRFGFQGHRYLIVFSTVPWEKAQKLCERMGGHLVYIETEAEREFLSDLMDKWTAGWVGATDKHKEGDWRWLNRVPVKKQFWLDNAPDGGKHQCYAGFGRGGLNDNDDKENKGIFTFICEWD